MGHRVAQCRNPTLKNVFCYHCAQRGHLFSKCPKRKSRRINKNSGKPSARVFALQHDEAPIVDTFAGMLSIASQDAYTLIDTGATHSCMSEEYGSECALLVEVWSDVEMCVSTPLGPGVLITTVVKSIDVIVKDKCMPVDQLVLPMSNFDIVLGMN